MNKHTVSNKGTDFNCTLHKIKRLYYEAIRLRDFESGAEKIRIDTKWTDLFQRLNGHGNSDVLNGFKLRLEIDEEDEQEEMHQK
jgi:hypothetical protein